MHEVKMGVPLIFSKKLGFSQVMYVFSWWKESKISARTIQLIQDFLMNTWNFQSKNQSFWAKFTYIYGSVALLWHNAKVLALLKVKCKIH